MTWPPNHNLILGRTRGRPPLMRFGIKQADRMLHMFILGKTGTGKSTLIANLALQDAAAGRGFCVVDPHGDLAEDIYQRIPGCRKEDVIYLNVPEVPKAPEIIGYNPLRYVSAERRSLAAAGLLEVFKKLWSDSWGVRMEHILRNTILTLLEIPGSTLADIPRLLTSKRFRTECVSKLENTIVQAFWKNEFERYSYPFQQAAIAPILNKVGAFLTDPVSRKLLTAPDDDLSFRKLMDDGKILIVNLARGQIGEDTSNLIGSLIITTLGLASYSRSGLHAAKRRPFHIFVDEFQTFSTLSAANMIGELRKYGVSITAASQTLTNIQPEIRDAMLGNCGSLLSFRIGSADAERIAKELAPIFEPQDLIALPNYQITLKIMIDGEPCRAFGATTERLPDRSSVALGCRHSISELR